MALKGFGWRVRKCRYGRLKNPTSSRICRKRKPGRRKRK